MAYLLFFRKQIFYKATSTTYAFRAGRSNAGVDSGNFFINIMLNTSWAAWGGGAAISFKPIYDYFYQSSGTKCSMKGGSPENGYNCGIFSININGNFSNYRWDRGASISFKLVAAIIVIIFIKVIIQDMLFVVIHQNMDYILDHFVFH